MCEPRPELLSTAECANFFCPIGGAIREILDKQRSNCTLELRHSVLSRLK